jgi:cytochrome o ubiquinol oxidase operon protein cyoD
MKESVLEGMGANRGSLGSYGAGFLFSIVLTGAAFALVMSEEVSRTVTVAGIFVAAVLQILVHLHYFLHLDRSSAARWNVLALLFTVLIMFLFVAGTLWIMYSLNYRMM